MNRPSSGDGHPAGALLMPFGDDGAGVCEGDFCALPAASDPTVRSS